MSNKPNKIVHPPKKQHLPSILFITHKYPPSIGGMQKQANKLISGIEKTYPVKKIVWQSRITLPYFLF
jgi:phosphatidylinositol alpha-1,6-mannosyltransferase